MTGGKGDKHDGKGGEAAGDTDIPPDEEVDEPQQIAGAALTCAAARDADADDADADGWLCAVTRDGKPVDIAQDSVTWRAGDGNNTVTFAVLTTSPTWHVLVRYPDAPPGATVSADVRAADGKSFTVTATLSRGRATVWHIGSDRDIHLGDGTYPDGNCKGPIAKVPLTGANVSIPLTVTSSTSLTVDVVEICGIDYDEVDLIITNASGAVHRSRLPTDKSTFRLADLKLLKGDYTLTIEPAVARSRYNDRDDFVFGAAFLTGANLTVGQPKAP